MSIRSVVLVATMVAASLPGTPVAFAQEAPTRRPDVIYVPTPEAVVEAMLQVANVGKNDIVYDLGCGDGRIPVTAAKKYGATGVGIDIDPQRIKEAKENVAKNNVGDKVTIIQGDLFEQEVLIPAQNVQDPLERLRVCMERNIKLVTGGRSKEVLIILHEHATLTGEAKAHINARKKNYVHLLEQSFREAMARGQIRRVEPRVAAFAFLGQVLWIYKWFHPNAGLTEEEVCSGLMDLFFTGLKPTPQL